VQSLGARTGVSSPRYATLGIHAGLPIYQTPHLGSTLSIGNHLWSDA